MSYIKILIILSIFFIIITLIISYLIYRELKENITYSKYKKVFNLYYEMLCFSLKNTLKTNIKEITNYEGNKNLRIEQKIPYNIIQTFKTRKVTESMYNITRKWINYNPEYNYMFFDDNEINDYINKEEFKDFEFSKEDFLTCYNSIKPGAGKADLFRLLIIYNLGGCYFDIDTQPIKPLKDFIYNDDEVVSGIGGRGDFHQWGLIYIKNHIFIKKTLELAVKNINNQKIKKDIKSLEYITGPPCMDEAIKDSLKSLWMDKILKCPLLKLKVKLYEK